MTFFDIFSNNKIKIENNPIIIDYREKNSLVPAELKNLNKMIKFDKLKVGDYITNNIIIERKTLSDLQNSIINKRIFSQINNLKENKSILILEFNSEDLFIHENAIKGFLISLALEHKIPYIISKNPKETARYISIISNREDNKSFSMRQSKKFDSKEERVKYILEGFPGIGPIKSKRLLEQFGSIKNIVNAEEKDLSIALGKITKDFKNLIS